MNSITINEFVRKLGYNPPSDDTYSHIDDWLEWYQGDVEKFHQYTVFNGISKTKVTRKKLGMAKKVCEDWANLILNEKVDIKAGNYDQRLEEILKQNNFATRANQLIELAYALGTGAFVEYMDGEDVVIDYVRADMILPLSWDNGDIIECAFGSTRMIHGKEQIYLQIHRLGVEANGENPAEYYIENKYVDAESGDEIEGSDGVLEIVPTGSKLPLFQIIVPNIQNNIDLDSPLGISVYANSIDQLRGCDIVYDSYINEFVLGKKRIIVPTSAAKIDMSKDGTLTPIFDTNDVIYYAMPGDRQGDAGLIENNMTIRSSDHELGIQRAMDLLSLKCGMGTGRYQLTGSGVKTATEVISDKSDLYQNLKRNEIPVEAAIASMVKAIAFLDGHGDVDVTINFDDSIIEDSNSIIDKNIKLVQAGLRSKLSAIMEIEKCSEDDARKELELIQEDGQVTGQSIDWTHGEESDKEETEQPKEDTEDKEGEDVDDTTGDTAIS